jgi:predicted lipid-binding transport protein (Tim44 family)
MSNMKKWLVVFMALSLFLSVSAPAVVDAAPRGGKSYSSPKRSVTPTKPAPANNNANKADPNASNAKTGTTQPTTPNANRGLMGGGMMKGLMLGGLAGMLFGGLLGGLGAFGNLLGLLINVAAIVILVVLIRRLFVYFRDKSNTDKKRYQE